MVNDLLRQTLSYRHLLKRQAKHIWWKATRQAFAATQTNLDLAHTWVRFEIPIANHSEPREATLHNMRLACRRISGLILRPGEIFSFWERLGRPSQDAGFQNNGGLCPIAGVLFNLALEAGCDVIERHPHSLNTDGGRKHLPLGRDATVTWVSKDLAFINSTGILLRLTIEVDGQRVFGSVQSALPMPHRIRIEEDRHPSSHGDKAFTRTTTTRYISMDGSTWRPHGKFESEYHASSGLKSL